MITDLLYNGKPSHRKFQRGGLKIGVRKTCGYEPNVMGDIEDGVSHFLCPEHETWLPRQRYETTLQEKQNRRMRIARKWLAGLVSGTYQNRADIARTTNISRARVTQLLNEFEQMKHA